MNGQPTPITVRVPKTIPRFYFLANQEQGIHIQMELVLVKSEAIFVRIPLSVSGSPMMNKDFPNRSSYSGLVAQGPLLAFTTVPQQLN